MSDEHREWWAAGKLVPARITLALDLRGLYGPEVDTACGAREPDVDRWEEGVLYPTWEQLLKLAELTDFPVLFFFCPAVAPPPRVWLCNRARRKHGCQLIEPPRPVVAFTEDAIRARLRPEGLRPVQGSLF